MTEWENLVETVKELYNETANFDTAHFRNVSFTSPVDGKRYAIAMSFYKVHEKTEDETDEIQ